jgi:hypothetical protein
MTSIVVPIAIFLGPAAPCRAQTPPPAAAFLTEAAGASVGSAIGFGTVLLLSTRGNGCGDDLSCTLGNVAAAVTLGTAGAAAGSYIAGSMRGTRPSLTGAVLGAVAGAAAAIGVNHLVTEEASKELSDAGTVALFAVTQGLVTALGSRIAAAVRDR